MEVAGGGIDEVSHAERQPNGIKAQELHAAHCVEGIQAEGSWPLVEPVSGCLTILRRIQTFQFLTGSHDQACRFYECATHTID